MYDGLDLPDPGYGGDEPRRSAASPGRGSRLYRIAAILLLLGAALALLTMLRSAL